MWDINMCDQEERIKVFERLVKELKSQYKKTGGVPSFERVPKGSEYFRIGIGRGGEFTVETRVETNEDLGRRDRYNYFYSHQRAEEVVNKINLLLKVEQIRDQYFPDYVPDWRHTVSPKWYITFNPFTDLFEVNGTVTAQYHGYVYFPDRKVADEICRQLNKLNKNKKNGRSLLKNIVAKDASSFKRVPGCSKYFRIDSDYFGYLAIYDRSVVDDTFAQSCYENNNYFCSQKRAKEIIRNIMYLIKLERLHDRYCPNYIPDWGNTKSRKWYVVFDEDSALPHYDVKCTKEKFNGYVHFPSEEIAEKVRRELMTNSIFYGD